MGLVIDILIALAMLAVVVTLGMGLYSMARGGEYDRERSTKLMGWRVKLQAVAVGLLVLGFIYKASH